MVKITIEDSGLQTSDLKTIYDVRRDGVYVGQLIDTSKSYICWCGFNVIKTSTLRAALGWFRNVKILED